MKIDLPGALSAPDGRRSDHVGGKPFWNCELHEAGTFDWRFAEAARPALPPEAHVSVDGPTRCEALAGHIGFLQAPVAMGTG